MGKCVIALLALLLLAGCAGEELDNDAKLICDGFRREFRGSNDYEQLFATYYYAMERTLETRKGKRVVNSLLELVEERENPKRTSDSIWRLERQTLARCGYDVDREERSRY